MDCHPRIFQIFSKYIVDFFSPFCFEQLSKVGKGCQTLKLYGDLALLRRSSTRLLPIKGIARGEPRGPGPPNRNVVSGF